MSRTCTVDGCAKPHLAKGWCATHYMRVRTTGDAGGAELLRTPGTPGLQEKRCTRCGETKPRSEFYADKRNRSGLTSHCKTCWETGQRPGRIKRKYGITEADYDDLMARQDGKCEICRRAIDLVIDHCHRSGKVRALLCDRCNRLLGVADDDVDLLRRALDFLNSHKGEPDGEDQGPERGIQRHHR